MSDLNNPPINVSNLENPPVKILVHFDNFSGDARRLVRDVRDGKRKAVLLSKKGPFGTIGFQGPTGRISKTQITLPYGDYRITQDA